MITLKENSGPEDDMESDNLESQQRSRRDASEESNEPDDIRSYDPNLKTNHYSSKGSYTIELVGQRRLSRNRRHTEREPTDMVASTLLGFINQSELFHSYVIQAHTGIIDISISYLGSEVIYCASFKRSPVLFAGERQPSVAA